MLVSIDPGNDTGWAIWESNAKTLVDCGLGDPRESPRHVAADISDVWIESPRIYPHGNVRPNDIVELAKKAGWWAGVYSVIVADAHFVEPFRWKGQVPKEIHHPRLWGMLTHDEQKLVDLYCKGLAPSKRHNVLDAVGIGLWALKRTSKLRLVGEP